MLKPLKKCQNTFIFHILACHLQIDADPVPDPAYHFDVGPDADPDLDFYLMRMRIQLSKMMLIADLDADPDPQHCFLETTTSRKGRGHSLPLHTTAQAR
jgi:hypothetical protein